MYCWVSFNQWQSMRLLRITRYLSSFYQRNSMNFQIHIENHRLPFFFFFKIDTVDAPMIYLDRLYIHVRICSVSVWQWTEARVSNFLRSSLVRMYAFIHAHVRTYSSRSRYGRAVGPSESIADSLDTMPWSLNWNKTWKSLLHSPRRFLVFVQPFPMFSLINPRMNRRYHFFFFHSGIKFTISSKCIHLSQPRCMLSLIKVEISLRANTFIH